MTDMVERSARARCIEDGYCVQPPIHVWEKYKHNARTVLEVAFQVTDEDAKAFMGEENANITWEVNQRAIGEGEYEFVTFSTAMQALSDAALKEES